MSNANIKRVKSSDIELKDKLVSIQRVTKVTKGGRNFTFSAIVVVGNEKGIVGYGLGKAKEVTDAITKGIDDAKKNLIKVAIVKGTVPHEQYGKFSGSLVFLKPAAHGTGVIAGRLSPGMMLTDFITKTPDGEQSEVILDEKFKKVFNILADKPETVAKFFIPKILGNTKNDVQITWLTNKKATWRFITAAFRKNRLI